MTGLKARRVEDEPRQWRTDVRAKAGDDGRVEVKWSHVRSLLVSRWEDQRVVIIATLLVLKGLLMVGPWIRHLGAYCTGDTVRRISAGRPAHPSNPFLSFAALA